MVTTTRSLYSDSGTGFNPADFKRVIEEAKQRGALRAPGEAVPIEKPKEPALALGAVKAGWMDVTPAIAKNWLENNFRNRPVKDDVVAAYARDMINGVWVPTHQGVAFNDKDELIDGQHRLLAIVRSGVTIRMMVTFGLPSVIAGKEMTTMDAVDRGCTRSVADQLKIQHGMKDGSIIAAVSASLATICSGERTRRLSVGQTLEVFRAFGPAVKFVIAHRSKEPGLRAVGVLAGFAFAFAATQPKSDRIATMFESLVSGAGIKPVKYGELGTPMAHLRAFLVSDDAKLLSRATDRGLAELVQDAIRLELRGKPVAKLEPSLEGVNYFREMQKPRVYRIGGLFKLPSNKQP